MIEYCKENKTKGLIVLINFEKAFDSMDWGFISNTLKSFNFGPNILKWIKSIQVNSYSYIVQNGHISRKILLHRGCRQGDPVLPYVFVLAAEIMATAVREKKTIKGISVHNKEQKISKYADDTTFYLAANEKNLMAALSALQEFEEISGLKINIEKTKIIKIGVWGDSRINFCKGKNLIWTTEFTSLGILFNIDKMTEITEINMEIKIDEISRIIRIWTPRFLTPIGKMTIIKSLLTSKFVHILLSLPSPKIETFTKVDKIYQSFLWGVKPPKFRKEILQNPVEYGGLSYPFLIDFDKSLKITWLRRIIKEKDVWSIFPNFLNIHKIFLFGDSYFDTIIKRCKNFFWTDVIYACKSLYDKMWTPNISRNIDMPIWYNSRLCNHFNKEWFNKGLIFVKDLFLNRNLVSRLFKNHIRRKMQFFRV